MKNVFHRLFSRQDTTEVRIFELEDILIQTLKTKKFKKNKDGKKQQTLQRLRITTNGIKYVMGISEERKKEGKKEKGKREKDEEREEGR